MTRGRKKSENPKNITLQIRVNKELDNSLESFAKASNLKKSEAARSILRSVLLQKKII